MSTRSSCDEEDYTRYHATSTTIQRWITQINRRSPINLEFFTDPLCKASAHRVRSVEDFYIRSRVFRFLIRKGVNPVLLFLSTSAGLILALRRLYTRSTYLTLNIVGVMYPAWRCWHLVKEFEQEDHADKTIDTLRECKSWLTYWILYGCIQDAWANDILSLCPNYNLYKLLILYWAQSPHSRGAYLLYRHVLQKPRYDDDSVQEEKGQQQQQQPQQQQQQQQYYYNPIPPKMRNDENLALTVDSSLNEIDSDVTSFRVLDGYTPPSLANDHDSNSSGCGSISENRCMEITGEANELNKEVCDV
ncbi:hypothetical protein DFQ28_002278 [Apophysomyces sp. BC1034]|nr:hypothetical protein DFQ28_002278 [Apophysomyces sp. BC1034]